MSGPQCIWAMLYKGYSLSLRPPNMNTCFHWPSCANRAPIMVYLLKMNSAMSSEHPLRPPLLGEDMWSEGASLPTQQPRSPGGGGAPVQEVEGGAPTPTGGSCRPELSLHPRHHAVRPQALLHL